MRSSYKKVSGMTAEIKIRRCYGCGATIQSEDRYESGYVDPSRAGDDSGLCDRCYRLRHPQEEASRVVTPSFRKLVEEAKRKRALLCYILDAFSLDASVVPSISELLKGSKVLVVVNKVDLLPETVSSEDLIEGVKSRLSEGGVEPLDIVSCSANDQASVAGFKAKIDQYRRGEDVYLLGAMRVGKSAIVDTFLKFYENTSGRTITRERFGESGNELTLTAIPLDASSTLYDTPGVFEPSSMANQLDRRALKYIVPRTRVQARSFSIKNGEGLAFGALSYAVLTYGEKAEGQAYFSSDVELIKLGSRHVSDSFTALCQDGKGHPSSPTVRDADALVVTEVPLPSDGKEHLISIVGFGRLSLRGEGQRLDFYLPRDVRVLIHG